MNLYANLSGNSPVIGYEVGENSIRVFFIEDRIYLYNDQKPGLAYVNQMIALAQEGKGLSAYITKSVGKNFAARER